MTENLAGQGEGLAGAIACVKEFIAWAREQIGTSEAHGCAEQAEDALKLLEATAPAGTAQLARQMLDLVELYVVGDDGNYHAPSNYMTPEQWTALVIGLEEAALATPSPQAPQDSKLGVNQFIVTKSIAEDGQTINYFVDGKQIFISNVAATQEPAGSGAQETAKTWLREHKKVWSAYDLYSLIRLLEARSQTIEPLEVVSTGIRDRNLPRSPRKVGEDALATYLLNTSPPDWEYDKVITMAAESLSLSSPIEPPPTITPQMMSGVFAKSVNNSDPEHDHVYDHRIAAAEINRLLGAEASSEIRERPNLLSSIPLATGKDSTDGGWTVNPAFLLEVKELLMGDERVDLEEHVDLEGIEAVVLALNQLQTKRALAPSRQGAAKRVEG